jgi:hypothetical protein
MNQSSNLIIEDSWIARVRIELAGRTPGNIPHTLKTIFDFITLRKIMLFTVTFM